MDPIRGAEKDGVQGFFKGVGRGLFGYERRGRREEGGGRREEGGERREEEGGEVEEEKSAE